MPERLFHWRGRDREGRVVTGQMHAQHRTQVQAHLEAQRIRPTHIRTRLQFTSTVFGPSRRASAVEVTQLTRQLATLIQAGVPLFQALQVLTQSATTPVLRELTQALQHDLSQGMAFHQALQNHLEFDAFYCHLVAAAEFSGTLDAVLTQLAQHREKSDALARQIRAALFYPCIVIAVAMAVMSLLMAFVVPSFEEIFLSFGAELPWLTQSVIHLSHLWLTYFLISLVVCMCATLGWRHVLQTHDHLVLRRDALLLKTPWVKHLIQQSCVARWTRTMATLFAAGVPLTQALAYTRPVTGNRMYELATHDMAQQLLSGHTLSQGLGAHGALFPALLVQMCAIGEESGALEHMLSKMADMAEQDLHTSVTYLSKLVEPTLMLILGLGVGVLVMALYLPIFQMGQVV